MAKAYVYDYETVVNCFLAVFINVKNTNDILVFEISNSRNQLPELTEFLDKCIANKTTLVSYNGLKFDNQISMYLINNRVSLDISSNSHVAHELYLFGQEVIKRSNAKEFPYYHPKDNPFKECDILAINNYDNPAKRCSLK